MKLAELKKKYGTVVEGPMGYRMPEAVARAIETMAAGLPKDFHYRRMARKSAEPPAIMENREEVSYINTDAVDRASEVVLPTGMMASDYNHVVAWAHDYEALPVGVCLWMKAAPLRSDPTRQGIVAKTRYHTRPSGWEGDWLPDAIVHLQSQTPPSLGDKSIGFLPLSMREATSEELDRRPDWKGVPIIDRWAIMEYSVVPIGCNPEAHKLSAPLATIITKAAAAFGPVVVDSHPAAPMPVQPVAPPAEPEPPVQPKPPAPEGFVLPNTVDAAVAERVREVEARMLSLITSRIEIAMDRLLGRV